MNNITNATPCTGEVGTNSIPTTCADKTKDRKDSSENWNKTYDLMVQVGLASLDAYSFRLYMVLSSHANRNREDMPIGSCFPSRELLKKECNMCPRQLVLSVKDLVARNLITVTSHKEKGSKFRNDVYVVLPIEEKYKRYGYIEAMKSSDAPI